MLSLNFRLIILINDCIQRLKGESVFILLLPLFVATRLDNR